MSRLPSKYPPAKPGALEMGPLKAARIDMKFPTSTLALLMPHLIPNSRTQRQWQVSKATLFSSEVGRPMSAGPSRNDFSCAWWLKSAFRRWATAGNVKLLLPPRQSRGASLGRLAFPPSRFFAARDREHLTSCRAPSPASVRRQHQREFS